MSGPFTTVSIGPDEVCDAMEFAKLLLAVRHRDICRRIEEGDSELNPGHLARLEEVHSVLTVMAEEAWGQMRAAESKQ